MLNSVGKITKFIAIDFDKTIVDLGVDWQGVRRRIVESYGVTHASDHTRSLFGIMDENPEISEHVFGIIKEGEMQALQQKASLVSGAKEFLEWLGEKGIPFAVVSNNHHHVIEKAFQVFGLPLPAMIVGSDDVAKRKPHPDGLEKILAAMDVEKDHCVLVGDSDTEAELGKTMGIDTYIMSDHQNFNILKQKITYGTAD